MCVKIGERRVTSQRRVRMMCARDISSDETGSRSAIRVWVNPGRGPRRLIHATRGVRGRDRGLNARVGVHCGVNSRSRFVHTVPSTLGARVDPALDTAARRYSLANCHGTHLEALGEGAVAGEVGLEPLLGLDVVAVLVLGGLASTTATRAVSREGRCGNGRSVRCPGMTRAAPKERSA